MTDILKSDSFALWLDDLADRRARARIQVRIDRMASGAMGDVKSLGAGIHEARIDYGPGYRLYFLQRGELFIVLLCGGDKSSQARDITQARLIAKTWKELYP